jgi:hypothetical protein
MHAKGALSKTEPKSETNNTIVNIFGSLAIVFVNISVRIKPKNKEPYKETCCCHRDREINKS